MTMMSTMPRPDTMGSMLHTCRSRQPVCGGARYHAKRTDSGSPDSIDMYVSKVNVAAVQYRS